jgi:diacylglycerol kinase (ATP)
LAGVEVRTTTSGDDLAREAAGAVAQGIDRLVVAGGDGSLHQVLPALAGSSTVLGIVPAGRGNDMAGCLGLPFRPEEALARALGPRVRALDAGVAAGRLYAGIAGVGFDGEVATFVRTRRTVLRGRAVYPYAVIRTLAAFRCPRLRLEHDGGVVEGPAVMVLAANLSTFGGGMRAAPAAEPDDGLLDLVLIREVPRWTLLRLLPLVYRGAHVHHAAVSVVRSRSAVLTSDRPLVPHADGEPLCGPVTRVAFEVARGALLVAA